MQVKELQLASLNFDIKNDYAIIQIDNGKVNAINLSLLQDLNTAFTTLSSDESVKGAILSGRPHAFSAGLDLMSLATTDAAGMVTFWEAYGQALKSMVTYDKPLVCAITGYAPAGATILTLCTDYRIMGKGEKHVIGMHEFKMQMQIPKLLCEVYAYHLGEIKAWKFIQQSRLFNSDQAVEVGLVDESLTVEEVLPRAEEYLQNLIAIHPKVFAESKGIFNKKLRDIILNYDLEKHAIQTVEFNNDPELRAKVLEYMMSLKKT